MRKLKIFGFLTILGILIVACQKDKANTLIPISNDDSNVFSDTRSLSAFQDSFWVAPEGDKLWAIIQDMASKATLQEMGEYLDTYGDFKWENARLVHEFNDQKYIVSIPAFKNDEMVSILFASVIDGAFNYWHFTLDEMAQDMDVLLQDNSAQSIALALLEIVVHGQNISSIPLFAYSQLSYQQLQDLILEVTPRGWCLKRYYLTQPEGLGENGDWRIEQTFTSDDSPNGGSYYHITNGFNSYPIIDGKVFINGEYLTLDEFAANKKATIQGIIVGNVRIMWVWGFCPDEVGQDPWSFNWTTNTSTPPGSTNNDNDPPAPDWDYNETNWDDPTKDCFLVGGSHQDNAVSQFREELLANSCGAAARYNILNQVNTIMNAACAQAEDYFNSGDGNPPPTLDELKTKIEIALEGNNFVEMGKKICEVCGDDYQCLTDMDACPLENYESCVEEKLCDYAIEQFNSDYELNLSESDMDLVEAGVSSCGSPNFVSDAFSVLINNITGGQETTVTLNLLSNFVDSKDNKLDALNYISRINDLKTDDPAIRYDRAVEFYNLLSDNPDALTACNNPPQSIEDWSTLASFVPPQNILDLLTGLGEGWKLQGFQTPTAAPSINLDYFSTNITEMPLNPNTGQKFLPQEFFDYFRVNINDFVDKEASEFLDDGGWDSSNPLGTVLSIDINGPDNGSVICSQFEDCCWIFSTVKAPFMPGFDGYHPVSGNRQFGYLINADGSMTIFTKGADRFFSPAAPPFANVGAVDKLAGYLLEKVAFAGADGLWNSMQAKISEFVNDPSNDGAATANTPIVNRPKVGDALKNLLKQNETINYVPCGN